jgi:anti-sigma B factor antagonist
VSQRRGPSATWRRVLSATRWYQRESCNAIRWRPGRAWRPSGHRPILTLAGQRACPLPEPCRRRDTLTRASPTRTPTAAMLLDLHVTSTAGHTAVEVGGELDVASASELRDCLRRVIDAGSRRLVVDLRRVCFVDSVGLGVLVGARRRLLGRGDDGSIELACVGGLVIRILRMTGLDRVFPVHASLADAPGGDVGQADRSGRRGDRSKPEPARRSPGMALGGNVEGASTIGGTTAILRMAAPPLRGGAPTRHRGKLPACAGTAASAGGRPVTAAGAQRLPCWSGRVRRRARIPRSARRRPASPTVAPHGRARVLWRRPGDYLPGALIAPGVASLADPQGHLNRRRVGAWSTSAVLTVLAAAWSIPRWVMRR